jgi:hypothetical protein
MPALKRYGDWIIILPHKDIEKSTLRNHEEDFEAGLGIFNV